VNRFLPQSLLLTPHSYQGDAVNTTLTVDDPLAGQEVTIVITLPRQSRGEQSRDERPALVSLGLAGQLPVSKSGLFGDAPALINELWAAFGLRWKTEAARAAAEGAGEEESGTAEAETVAEVTVVATTPRPQPTPAPAEPRPQNLSLF
jgi:hypothetical protein